MRLPALVWISTALLLLLSTSLSQTCMWFTVSLFPSRSSSCTSQSPPSKFSDGSTSLCPASTSCRSLSYSLHPFTISAVSHSFLSKSSSVFRRTIWPDSFTFDGQPWCSQHLSWVPLPLSTLFSLQLFQLAFQLWFSNGTCLENERMIDGSTYLDLQLSNLAAWVPPLLNLITP